MGATAPRRCNACALGELIIDGIDTTVPLFFDLLDAPDVQSGDYNIHWLEKFLDRTLKA